LIVTSDRSALGIFRDGIEENADLKIHVGESAYVDAAVFHDYLRDGLIPHIEDFRETNTVPNSPAILFMEFSVTSLFKEKSFLDVSTCLGKCSE
jgi:hypothetical protein